MTLSFTEEEMISFIEKKGYRVEEVDAWYSEYKYHHGDEMTYIDVKIKIAYKYKLLGRKLYRNPHVISERPDIDIKRGEQYNLESLYGIKTIFGKLMHKALLNL